MDDIKEEVIERTDEQKAEDIENLLIESGVMIPGQDLVHYMIRNVSYMRLINSEQFKASGISLEEVLDDAFIQEESQKSIETTNMMRFVTEKVVAIMNEVTKPTTDFEEQPETLGILDGEESDD